MNWLVGVGRYMETKGYTYPTGYTSRQGCLQTGIFCFLRQWTNGTTQKPIGLAAWLCAYRFILQYILSPAQSMLMQHVSLNCSLCVHVCVQLLFNLTMDLVALVREQRQLKAAPTFTTLQQRRLGWWKKSSALTPWSVRMRTMSTHSNQEAAFCLLTVKDRAFGGKREGIGRLQSTIYTHKQGTPKNFPNAQIGTKYRHPLKRS